MFKAITLYKFTGLPDLVAAEAAMEAHRFVPCGLSQEESIGFIEPRGEDNGPLIETVAGQVIMRVKTETRSVPGEAVREKAQAEADHIEATQGRKPGKKETKQLREDAQRALLPSAFPRKSAAWVWFNRETGVLVIGSASQARLDDIITLLVRTFDDLKPTVFLTATTAQTAMTAWLSAESPDEWPEGISVERTCELKASDETRAVVKFDRHNLDNEGVRKHITEGKLPTKLALSWEGRVGFMITDALRIGKIQFLEGVFDDYSQDDASGFDADVTISTGELNKMIPALVAALGGELVIEEKSAAPEPAPGEPDELLEKARKLITSPDGYASISFVQRRLQIGYNRAARLMEELERLGVVSAMQSDGSRVVMDRS